MLMWNKAAQEMVESDPLYFGWKINAGFLAAFMDAAKSARRTLDRVSYPFLILHSPNDTLAAPRGSRELFTRARSERKAFLMAPFKACSHELHNEVAFEAPVLAVGAEEGAARAAAPPPGEVGGRRSARGRGRLAARWARLVRPARRAAVPGVGPRLRSHHSVDAEAGGRRPDGRRPRAVAVASTEDAEAQ